MSLDSKAKVVPTIILGEDKTLNFKLTVENDCQECNDPFDLTGATEIECIFLKNDNTGLLIKLTDLKVVILNAAAGKFQALLSAAETEELALPPDGEYADVEVRVTIGGKKTIVLLRDSVQILNKIYPSF